MHDHVALDDEVLVLGEDVLVVEGDEHGLTVLVEAAGLRDVLQRVDFGAQDLLFSVDGAAQLELGHERFLRVFIILLLQ